MQFPRAERVKAFGGEKTVSVKEQEVERSKLWMGVVVSRLAWLKRMALLRNNEKWETGVMKWGREGVWKNEGRRWEALRDKWRHLEWIQKAVGCKELERDLMKTMFRKMNLANYTSWIEEWERLESGKPARKLLQEEPEARWKGPEWGWEWQQKDRKQIHGKATMEKEVIGLGIGSTCSENRRNL